MEVPGHLSVSAKTHRLLGLGTSFTSTEIRLDGHLLILHEDTLVARPEQLAELVGASTKSAPVTLSGCRLGPLSGKMYDSSPPNFTWIDWWVRGSQSLFCANVQKEQIEDIFSSVVETIGSPKA